MKEERGGDVAGRQRGNLEARTEDLLSRLVGSPTATASVRKYMPSPSSPFIDRGWNAKRAPCGHSTADYRVLWFSRKDFTCGECGAPITGGGAACKVCGHRVVSASAYRSHADRAFHRAYVRALERAEALFRECSGLLDEWRDEVEFARKVGTDAREEASARVEAELGPVRAQREQELGLLGSQIAESVQRRDAALQELHSLNERREAILPEVAELQKRVDLARTEFAKVSEETTMARLREAVDVRLWLGDSPEGAQSWFASEGLTIGQVRARQAHMLEVRAQRGKPWAETQIDRLIERMFAMGCGRGEVQRALHVGVGRINRVRRQRGNPTGGNVDERRPDDEER